ncbi:MAG: 3-dehydroquinate synthase [bacterium]|nr:3-dehydroquinate synthase [bacterium]
MNTVSINIPATKNPTYSVLIGEGVLKELPTVIANLGLFDSVALLYDEAVQGLAEKLDIEIMIPIKSGESSKTMSEAERITSELLARGINRQSLLICLGGGMVTDLGGFVASSYMRGIGHINIPTTVLGMVDASVGGKTGVDIGAAKNIVGHFHHPRSVIVDTDTLSTLPKEQFCEGLVEIIKIAAIMDKEFFEELESNIEDIILRDRPTLTSCIQRAIQLKAVSVEEDEKDTGKRLLLNFGHTVGHALEVLLKFTLSHGKAVSIGMACEMQLTDSEDADRVIRLLERIDMPTKLPQQYSAREILEAMKHDKKAISSSLRFAAPKRIGEGTVMELDTNSFELQFS